MQKAILASELKKLQNTELTESMSDDEIIDSYLKCGYCGKETGISQKEKDHLVESSRSTEDFLYAVDLCDHEYVNTFFIKISHFSNEQKIVDAVEIASAGLLNLKKHDSSLVLDLSVPDPLFLSPLFVTLPYVIYHANGNPCNIDMVFSDQDHQYHFSRRPAKSFTLTQEEQNMLLEMDYGEKFIEIVNPRVVRTKSVFSDIVQEYESFLPFRPPDQIVMRGDDKPNMMIDFFWYETFQEDSDIDWVNMPIDLSKGYSESSVKINVLQYEGKSPETLLLDLSQTMDNIKADFIENSLGKVFCIEGKTKIPTTLEDQDDAARIFIARLRQFETNAILLTFGSGIRYASIPTRLMDIADDMASDRILTEAANRYLGVWKQETFPVFTTEAFFIAEDEDYLMLCTEHIASNLDFKQVN